VQVEELEMNNLRTGRVHSCTFIWKAIDFTRRHVAALQNLIYGVASFLACGGAWVHRIAAAKVTVEKVAVTRPRLSQRYRRRKRQGHCPAGRDVESLSYTNGARRGWAAMGAVVREMTDAERAHYRLTMPTGSSRHRRV